VNVRAGQMIEKRNMLVEVTTPLKDSTRKTLVILPIPSDGFRRLLKIRNEKTVFLPINDLYFGGMSE
jgi:hypothetical protein